eukprot:m51a1_g6621 hypothetical protein (87) ;mRNA; r:46338-46665
MSNSSAPQSNDPKPLPPMKPEEFEITATDHINKAVLEALKKKMDAAGSAAAQGDAGDSDGEWGDADDEVLMKAAAARIAAGQTWAV